MKYVEPNGLQEQLDAMRTKWPQAHHEPPKSGSKYDWHLILLPGFLLPAGWNKTICTILFLSRISEPCISHPAKGTASHLDGFYVDLPDLRLSDDKSPKYARPFAMKREPFWHAPTNRFWVHKEEIPGFPQWQELTRFWWHAQHHNPNSDTLFTAAMLIRRRLEILE